MPLVKRVVISLALVLGTVSGVLTVKPATVAAASSGVTTLATVSLSGVTQVGPVSCVSTTACFAAALSGSPGTSSAALLAFDPSGGSQGQVALFTGTGLPTSLSCAEASSSDVDCGYILNGTAGFVNMLINLSNFSVSGTTGPSPLPAPGTYQSIDCPDANACIAVGQAAGSSAEAATLEFDIFDNPTTTYQTQTYSDIANSFYGLSCPSSSECATTTTTAATEGLPGNGATSAVELTVSASSASISQVFNATSMSEPLAVSCGDGANCAIAQLGDAPSEGSEINLSEDTAANPLTLSGTVRGLGCTSTDACIIETSSGSSGSYTLTATDLTISSGSVQDVGSTTLGNALPSATGGVSCVDSDECVVTDATSAQLLQLTTPASTTISAVVNPSSLTWSSDASNTATVTLTVSASSGSSAPTGTVLVTAYDTSENNSVTLCPDSQLIPASSGSSATATCSFAADELSTTNPASTMSYTISAEYQPSSGSVFTSSTEDNATFTLDRAPSVPYLTGMQVVATPGQSPTSVSVGCTPADNCVFLDAGTSSSGNVVTNVVALNVAASGTPTVVGTLSDAPYDMPQNLSCFSLPNDVVGCIYLDTSDQVVSFEVVSDTQITNVGTAELVAPPTPLRNVEGLSCFSWSRCIAVGQTESHVATALLIDPQNGIVNAQATLPGTYSQATDVACPSQDECAIALEVAGTSETSAVAPLTIATSGSSTSLSTGTPQTISTSVFVTPALVTCATITACVAWEDNPGANSSFIQPYDLSTDTLGLPADASVPVEDVACTAIASASTTNCMVAGASQSSGVWVDGLFWYTLSANALTLNPASPSILPGEGGNNTSTSASTPEVAVDCYTQDACVVSYGGIQIDFASFAQPDSLSTQTTISGTATVAWSSSTSVTYIARVTASDGTEADGTVTFELPGSNSGICTNVPLTAGAASCSVPDDDLSSSQPTSEVNLTLEAIFVPGNNSPDQASKGWIGVTVTAPPVDVSGGNGGTSSGGAPSRGSGGSGSGGSGGTPSGGTGGNGGTSKAPTVPPSSTPCPTEPTGRVVAAIPAPGGGRWEVQENGTLVCADGATTSYGGVGSLGITGLSGSHPLAAPISDIATTGNGGGYWMVGEDGGVFAFGDAKYYGSTYSVGITGLSGAHPLAAPIVALVPTANDKGYWLLGADGGVFAFGDAAGYGSIYDLGLTGLSGEHPLAAPIVTLVPTPSGGGYWLLGADGGVFAFGDATYVGSLPQYGISTRDAANLVPTSTGYQIVLSTGAVVSFPV